MSQTIRVTLRQPHRLAPALDLMSDLEDQLQRTGTGSFIECVGIGASDSDVCEKHFYLLELTDPRSGLELVERIVSQAGLSDWDIWRITEEGEDVELLASGEKDA